MKTDKQTPTQIASEIMKGCGEEYVFDFIGHSVRCGMLKSGKLCPSCKSKILAYRTAWENECRVLEKMDNIWATEVIRGSVADRLHTIVSNRYAELTSALKILNTKEAEK